MSGRTRVRWAEQDPASLADSHSRWIGSFKEPAQPVDQEGGFERHGAEDQHRGRKSRPHLYGALKQQIRPTSNGKRRQQNER